MKAKKGPFDSLINEAISNMNQNDQEQKPVNAPIDESENFKQKAINIQKEVPYFSNHSRAVFQLDKQESEAQSILNNLNVQTSIKKTNFFNDTKGSTFPSLRKQKEDVVIVDYIKWFSELDNNDVNIVGGKGASLGEMYNSNFPVPPGFVITAQSFDYFMEESGLKEKIKVIIENIDLEDTTELQKASKNIRSLIESNDIPKMLKNEILESYHILSTEKVNELGISRDALNILKNSQEPIFVSIRSSATTEDLAEASFAGQQESFLNVKGDTNLIEYIKKCFSSLYTPRAIYYRNRQGFAEGQALLAVVVQKMIDSEKSGVVFSRDPVNLDENIVIEAVFGLGEGIVSGRIKPDHFIVSRDLKIKNIRTADKKIALTRNSSGENEIVKLNAEKSKRQVLTTAEAIEIANYALKLEDHYKKPQDIEFAIEAGVVYIVQSRPITTLDKKVSEDKVLSGTVILQGQSASPGIGAGIVRIIHNMNDLNKIKKGDILVTEMTNPDMVVAMQKSAAIVTDEGGMTSHAAIVSREMGIPCVVGTDEATKILKDGMKITVDGSSGKVYEGEIAESKSVEIKRAIETERIKLKVIVDLPDFAERAALSGIEFVGLTRLEGIIASMKKHPLKYEKENKLDDYRKIIEEGLSRILGYFKGVWFRASDIRTDEYGSLEGAPEREINPMLGFHGIRFSLKHPGILKAELEAMRNVASANPKKKIGIMFPQVITIEEVKEAKKYFNEYKTDNMEFGVMIETPAAVQIIEDISEEVDFVSFGTNDLTQYTLAVDRNNEDVQYLYNEMHPAIFSQIKRVIGACRRKNVETSICGQAGSKKEMVEFLFKKGIKSISVNADAAYEVSTLIKNLEEEWKNTRHDEIETQGNWNDKGVSKGSENREIQKRNKNNFRNSWNNKGSLGIPVISEDNERKVENQNKKKDKFRNNDESYLDINKESRNEYNKKIEERGGLLKNIRIGAEREGVDENEYKDNIGPIEPFNDLSRVEHRSEDIEEEIREENLEKIKEIGKNIKIEDDEGLSSNDKQFEDIGVYNPDETHAEKKKFKYDFDDYNWN